VKNAEVLARLLTDTKRRNLIVVSFRQAAVDRFRELVPRLDLAPGIDGAANWLLSGGSPDPGVVAFQLPITFRNANPLLEVTTRDKRRPRPPRGLRLAELALERRSRRARHLAQSDRHVRGRNHDLAVACARAGPARPRAPGQLRLEASVAPLSPGSAARRRPAAFAPRAEPPGGGDARAGSARPGGPGCSAPRRGGDCGAAPAAGGG
jgi:hypothetical protein